MSDIKQDVKAIVKVFIQMFVSIVVKESTKKLIKSLTQIQKKLLEAKIKNMSDDQLEQYFDNNPYFKNSLENTIKSVKGSPSAKGSGSFREKLQSIYETTFTENLLKILIWPTPKKILTCMICIALLAIIAISMPGNEKPVANFSSNATGLSVQFTDLSQNAKGWYWDFGDGKYSTDRNLTHNYSAAGNYTVSLTVNNIIRKNSTFAIITFPEPPDEPSVTASHVYAYITNTGSNTVSVIDTTTNNVTATVPVGNSPYGVAVNPDGTKVYVTNSGNESDNSSNVYVINTTNNFPIDTANNSSIGMINVGIWPVGVSVNNNVSVNVSVIDTTTNNATNTVDVGKGPWGVAVNPAEKKVYVANSGSNNVAVIDTATNNVTATTPVGKSPYGVAVTPDGTKVYVTNSGSNNVSVIDTAANNVTATVNVGKGPWGVAVNPDGTKVYVANYNSNNVSVIDTVNNSLIDAVNVGSSPYGIAATPDGTKVYVTNYNSNNVSVIDTATNNVTVTMNVGENPKGVEVTPDGTKVYVVNSGSNNVSVIDTATNNVTATVNVGKLPAAFGKFIGSFPAQPVLPVANFSTVTSGNAPLKVSFTDRSTGNPTEWNWTFGDGTSSAVQTPVHIYSLAGNYNVTLTVSNANGTASKTDLITVLPTKPDPEPSKPDPKPFEPVLPVANFSNVTSEKDPSNVSFTDRSTGNPTEWNWDFGDGTNSTVQNPVHTYNPKPTYPSPTQNYNVTLTVSNTKGKSSKTGLITIPPDTIPPDTVQIQIVLPVANFSSNVTGSYAPLSAQFTDLSKNATGWDWNFGDGNT
ncbi:MAG: PKD domain-containing protein, partial [Methanosarcina sp.]|nr:PKD domain-containing protein [Methanosarcina sp.]